MARRLPTLDADSLRRVAEHIRRLEMQIGNLERRLAMRKTDLEEIGPFKWFCRFKAGAAFTTADDDVTGTIQEQWGPGMDHPSTAATFENCLDHTDTSYIFQGDNGDVGYAVWTGDGTDWKILQMECPT